MAQDTNVVVVTGRLTEDAQLKQVSSGQPLMSFKLANSKRRRKVNDQWVDQPPNYFSILLWGRSAEVLKPYMTKGKQVAVSGRLQQRSYQLPEESRKRSVVEIVAENVQLLGSRSDGTGASGGYANSAASRPAYSAEASPDTAAPVSVSGQSPEDPFGPEGVDDVPGDPVPDDDIPF